MLVHKYAVSVLEENEENAVNWWSTFEIYIVLFSKASSLIDGWYSEFMQSDQAYYAITIVEEWG